MSRKPTPDPVAEEQMTKPETRLTELHTDYEQKISDMAASMANNETPKQSMIAALALAAAARRFIRAAKAANVRKIRVATARRDRAMKAAAAAEQELAEAGA